METIWAFVIIITASLSPADVSGDLLGGDVENRTTIYFATQEACEKAYNASVANKQEIEAQMPQSNVVITQCEGLQISH
jgi:hypothetical protein